LALICAVVGFNLCCADSVRAHALSFEGKGDSPWNDERTSLLSGQAIQNLDKPWNDERTSLLSGQAIQNSWDKPAVRTSHSEFGQVPLQFSPGPSCSPPPVSFFFTLVPPCSPPQLGRTKGNWGILCWSR
jgi:hypothetical protein